MYVYAYTVMDLTMYVAMFIHGLYMYIHGQTYMYECMGKYTEVWQRKSSESSSEVSQAVLYPLLAL